LVVYERLEEKERDELFNRCIPRLSIYEDVVVVSNDDLNEKHEKEIVQIRKEFENFKKEMYRDALMHENHPNEIKLRDLRNIEN